MRNTLYYGDNLDVLRDTIPSESVDLVYLDPPFNSNRAYNVLFKERSGVSSSAQIQAFNDTWTWDDASREALSRLISFGPSQVSHVMKSLSGLLSHTDMLAYLVMMAERLIELHRVLKPTGSIYLHCDSTASHYLKLVLDAIFGTRHFRNDIVWKRQSAHSDASRKFAQVSDTILFYVKSDRAEFRPQYGAHDPAYVEKFYRHDDGDGRGPYMLDNMTSPNPRPNMMYTWNGFTWPAKGWRYERSTMARLDREGRIYYPVDTYGELDTSRRPRLKRFLSEQEGTLFTNIWSDIQPLHGSAKERLGYPTQKPLALLERIIEASSNPGDVVLDPFCGCGTAVSAAQKLGRRWMGIDITILAVDLIEKRLIASYGEAIRTTFDVEGIPTDLDGALRLFQSSPLDFQRWAVSLVDGTPNERVTGDRGIDGIVRFPLERRDDVGECIVSVKGGKQKNPAMVRDLIGTVQSEHAEMGVMVTMDQATSGMIDATRLAGSYVWPVNHRQYPRVQVTSVADLLVGRHVNMPTPFLPYFKAQRISLNRQPKLFD